MCFLLVPVAKKEPNEAPRVPLSLHIQDEFFGYPSPLETRLVLRAPQVHSVCVLLKSSSAPPTPPWHSRLDRRELDGSGVRGVGLNRGEPDSSALFRDGAARCEPEGSSLRSDAVSRREPDGSVAEKTLCGMLGTVGCT